MTQNPRGYAKFFLIAPEILQLVKQAKDMAEVSIKIQDQHHNLSLTVIPLSREENKASKLTTTIASFTNPFIQPDDYLFNLVTKVMPKNVKRDLCAQSTMGAFVTEFIQKGNENLWSPMTKRSLLTWKSTCKKTNITVNKKIVKLQKDRCLFARMMVVCQSRSEFNLQEVIGTYESSLCQGHFLQQMVPCCIAQPKVH